MSGLSFVKDYAYTGDALTTPIARIVGQIVSPDDFAPERFADQYTATPTAVAKLKQSISLQWNMSNIDQSSARNALPVTDVGVFLFRNPFRHIVYNFVSPGTSTAPVWSGYKTLYVQPQGLNVSTTQQFPSNVTTRLNPLVSQPTSSAGGSFTAPNGGVNFAPHGPWLYPGKGEGRYGIYVDSGPASGFAAAPYTYAHGAAIVVSMFYQGATYTSGDTFDANVYQWSGGNWVLYGSLEGVALAAIGSNCTFPIDASGYYAVEVKANVQAVSNSNDNGNTMASAFTCYSQMQSVWAHLPLQNLTPALCAGHDITGIRMLGTSMLVRNTASELNQQGLLVALQADACEDWLSIYAQASTSSSNAPGTGFFNFCFSRAEQKNFRLATGYFGYVKPTNEHSFDYSTNVVQGQTTEAGYPVEMCFQLCPPQDYLVFAASTVNNLGGDCFLQVSDSVEYKTQDPWLERRKATTTPDEWRDSVMAVRSMNQHYENPLHLPSLLGSIFKTVGKYAPVAANIASAIPVIGNTVAAGIRGAGMLAEKAAPQFSSYELNPSLRMPEQIPAGLVSSQVAQSMQDAAAEDAREIRKRKQEAVQAVEEAQQVVPRARTKRARYRAPTRRTRTVSAARRRYSGYY